MDMPRYLNSPKTGIGNATRIPMYTPPWGGIFKKYQRTPITPITVGKKQKTVSSCLRSSPFQMDCWYAVSKSLLISIFILYSFRSEFRNK